MTKKIIIITFILIVIAAVLINVNLFSFSMDELIPEKRPEQDQYCFDFAGALPHELVREINTQGYGLKGTYDIDFVVVIIPSLGNKDIVEYTADLFSIWKIGKSTQGSKGILILIAMKEQQIKIEVGYDLEEIYTDQYVGQVEREMLKEFLEQADWERGFLATIENFTGRAYRMERKGLEVRDLSFPDYTEYYSGGAGAMNVFDFGAALRKPLPETPKELREYFSAQPTPASAFERYMEFNARNMSDYTVDLFSGLSREFFSHWRTSSGQRRAEAENSSGIPYIVRKKAKYAVVIFPCEGDIEKFIRHNPYFFIKTDKGWQIDINTMARSMIMFGGSGWHFLRYSHPYMFAFDDYLIRMNRYYPLNGQKAFLGLVYSRRNYKNKGYEVSPEWDSPAKDAGIEDKDILISVDGTPVTEAYQDWEMMKKYRPGDIVDVVVLRGEEKKRIKVKLGEITSFKDNFPWKRKEEDSWMGLYLGYSQPYERDVIESYVSVIYVVENSPAEKAGFKDGDLIYYLPEMKNQYATSADYINLLKNTKPGDKIKFKILRNLKEKAELTLEMGSYSPDREGL